MMLFTPNPELIDPARAITPERVLDMCDTLGIILEGSEPEYYLIWIAIEALSAPLPPCADVSRSHDLWVMTTHRLLPTHISPPYHLMSHLELNVSTSYIATYSNI